MDEAYTEQKQLLYVYIASGGTLRVGGREHRLEPGVLARVGPEGKRQIVPRPEGIRVLCLGGVPGKVYEPPAWTEIGAPPPQPPPPE
ncbi:MAG TPA: hypothetical protein VE401_04165 [Solirubrobacterales bacterium]|jgi:hypothetical protein|nr:hypothetical protein [Solirubrobacterales bacterium]